MSEPVVNFSTKFPLLEMSFNGINVVYVELQVRQSAPFY